MQTETAFDLRYNVAALIVAILGEDVATPEQAFATLEGRNFKLDEDDIQDIMKMDELGIKHREIAKIYGVSGCYISRKVRDIKKRISQTAI